MINNTLPLARWSFLMIILVIFARCGQETSQDQPDPVSDFKGKLYERISPETSGVTFNNKITESKDFNYFVYDGIYQGGGLGAGDINNDGLIDLYFAGNQVENKLYLNKGGFQFEDITAKAGVGDKEGWSTGVSMVDINQDGFLDIYVCRFLLRNAPDKTANLLYVNNGDGTFTERAKEYGIADPGLSIQGAFLDYDRDGDLDLFVVNQPPNHAEDKKLVKKEWDGISQLKKDYRFTDRLYQNVGNNKFVDVTAQSGVLSEAYGLSAVVSDLNNDGWLDIYVACDYEEPDMMYINQKNGTFQDQILLRTKHISNFSMGTDIADFNNDGLTDIYTVDMLAQDNYRQKANMSGMNPDKFWGIVQLGWHHQYMHNALQLNRGGAFSEIAQFAGVDKTDWSWASLFVDFDLDGYKDIYVTNGIRYDVRNKDFMHDVKEKIKASYQKLKPGEMVDVTPFLQEAPSKKIANLAFVNGGNLKFENKNISLGLDDEGFSNGAVYADLDNDGDYELIVNNVQDEAYIYKSNAIESGAGKSMKIKLKGNHLNAHGLGAKVYFYHDGGKEQMIEQNYYRGYLSSMADDIIFGYQQSVDSILVIWMDAKSDPQGKQKGQMIKGIKEKNTITLDYQNAQPDIKRYFYEPAPLFSDFTKVMAQNGFQHAHRENPFDDFKREVLLPHKMSQFGPGIAVGDVDANGLDDIYVSGAKGTQGMLYLQSTPTVFTASSSQPWVIDQMAEDLGCLFLDIDGDNDLDLYVVSGGNDHPDQGAALLQDRLYINDGKGEFSKAKDALPNTTSSGSCVTAADFDQDGDLDLFVGGRVVPGQYPVVPRSFLLQNDGGKFKDITDQVADGLSQIGLVTSALWSDYDNDGDKDLIITGEWLPVTIYQNNDGILTNVTAKAGLDRSNGLWNSISPGDVDNDGDMDYIIGNYGLNSKFSASYQEPLQVYSDDFDQNGSRDIVLAYFMGSKCYPVRGRQCSSEQIPSLANTFPTYHEFASLGLNEIYSPEALENAIHHQAYTLASSIALNQGDGTFEVIPLPTEAQLSTVFGTLVRDFDGDGNLDVLMGGNFYVPEVETGRQDAFIGVYLQGKGNGKFEAKTNFETGLHFLHNDVRSMSMISTGSGRPIIMVGNNDGLLQTLSWNKDKAKVQVEKVPSANEAGSILLPDGRKRMIEQYHASGYLSQNSREY